MPRIPELKESIGARGFPGHGSERTPITLYDLYKAQLPPTVIYHLDQFPNEAEWLRKGGLNKPPKLMKR
ncbi:MAG: hypothetical protein ACD_30C00092G0017 [uncultured bacterium]|uniref:Uncharacterized protein n=3 Tax=Candidatus Daviesiibacteriota TaxID=1752718 RepID=A0A0G0ET06_9BACT|nr:MAG: hypothetical protein ACD_30C00092G0017 [uncultured bacterium]KKQ10033.1 MAG: hypothetical protein US19_C0009G0035 [Candidatus Daviesbacteria bacterium GW2011_GWB1_36_5]KKQ15920.1 MAG: hypothetical protein US28_C0007G0011 [Candidatus Daviesbacteria bacterium GW2011_GWA1_36_8]OGE30789.1 MAG: hypothetical protein A3C99_00600 [Candidatus Daviesbacteria bacterium RIFCSPHIGHO2_02_FULL_37_9]OGE35181.1 MAG: hypothetical protein A3E66_01990 [Candidatus Daviesbacteria bacterium RIFCSPHIGHO2_12_FU